jgi:hypothetical protein
MQRDGPHGRLRPEKAGRCAGGGMAGVRAAASLRPSSRRVPAPPSTQPPLALNLTRVAAENAAAAPPAWRRLGTFLHLLLVRPSSPRRACAPMRSVGPLPRHESKSSPEPCEKQRRQSRQPPPVLARHAQTAIARGPTFILTLDLRRARPFGLPAGRDCRRRGRLDARLLFVVARFAANRLPPSAASMRSKVHA